MATTEILLTRPIGQEPGEVSAAMVKRQLSVANGMPIVCRINCDGGSVFEGLAIHDAFASYPGQKRCVVESSAFSMASVVAMAFDDRSITSNGYMMIHCPSIEDGSDPPVLAKLTKTMAAIYSKATRLPITSIASLMRAETFLDASESFRMGFVTNIAPMTQRAVAAFQSSLRGNKNFHAAIVARLRNEISTARAEWTSKIRSAFSETKCPFKAASLVDKQNPGLRKKLILEANSKGKK